MLIEVLFEGQEESIQLWPLAVPIQESLIMASLRTTQLPLTVTVNLQFKQVTYLHCLALLYWMCCFRLIKDTRCLCDVEKSGTSFLKVTEALLPG